MRKVIISKGNGHTEFKSEKPAQTVPVIVDNIIDEHTGLITHYVCEGGRIFTKEGYDKNFKISHGIKMKGKNFKGKSLDSRIIY